MQELEGEVDGQHYSNLRSAFTGSVINLERQRRKNTINADIAI